MCDINNCYKCKCFRLKEISEGEYIGWCSISDKCVDDVKGCVYAATKKDE